jgi:hypothetical protein
MKTSILLSAILSLFAVSVAHANEPAKEVVKEETTTTTTTTATETPVAPVAPKE